MANIKISNLITSSVLDGTELIPIVQNGANKQATVGQVVTKVDSYTKAESDSALGTKVDKVTGKALSTNDFTNSLLALLNLKKVKNVTTDAVNNYLIVTYTDDTISNLNLNSIVTDVNVTGASLNATSNVLTLTSDDGGADVTVDLSDFVNSSELNNALTLKQDILSEGAFVDGDKIKLDSTEEHYAKIVLSKNLVNEDNLTIGKYIDAYGNEAINSGYNYSEMIKVSENTAYATTTALRFLDFYDSSKTFLSSNSFISENTSFTTPLGTAFIVATFHASDIGNYQIELGNTVTAYEKYGRFLDDGLKKKSVSLNNFDFIILGKNLIDRTASTSEKYMTEAGNTGSSTVYTISDYIEVTPLETYVPSKELRFTTYFDENKEVVIGGSSSPVNEAFTIPSGVKYIRVTYRISDYNYIQLEKGDVSTAYEPYSYVFTSGSTELKFDTSMNTKRDYCTIATKQYVIEGFETNFYNENITQDFKKYQGKNEIILDIIDTRWKETSVSSKLFNISGLVNNNYSGHVSVVNDKFETLEKKDFQFYVSDKTNNNSVVIQNIGDSYTGRMTWANVFLNDSAVNVNATFVGLRNANSAPIKCDGQGGWTIANFFTVDWDGIYSQFMQPVNGDYVYYGKTSFWIDANSASPSYNASDFDDAKLLFDAGTGFKNSPTTNDIMSDTNGSYVNWDGSNWVSIDIATFGDFAFNYGKYRTAWNIQQPTIINVLLGTNDFAGTTESTFDNEFVDYKAKYEELITSIHADSPQCKVVVGIPVSSARLGKYGTIETERRKRGYFMLADAINKNFSNREAELIYTMDYHSIVDRYYGFNLTYEPPFDTYSGSIVGDNTTPDSTIHLGTDGFNQMGNGYMAMIQYLR